MTRRATARAVAASALLASVALVATACAAPDPYEDCRLGDALLAEGVPTEVLWATPAIEAAVDRGPGADIVGLDLCRPDDGWRWVVTRKATLDGDPDRGLAVTLDAVTGAVLGETTVDLDEAEAAASGLDVRRAVEASGESYPTPRLVSLRLDADAGRTTWAATIYDWDASARRTVAIDAQTGAVRGSTSP